MLRTVSLLVISVILCGADFQDCSSMIFNKYGEVDVGSMLFNCSQNIRGALFPPSMLDVTNIPPNYKPTIVNVSLAFNTIIEINDVGASITFDFWFRQYWHDPRWKFPSEMWDSISLAALYEGLELTPYIRNPIPLSVWLPDTYIQEAVDTRVQAELIHLFPNSSIWWSRHVVTVIKEGQFDLQSYPLDTQNFSMTLQSFAYATQYVVLLPFTVPNSPRELVTFNVDPSLTVESITLNPLWTFEEYSSAVYNQPLGNFFDPYRNYSTISIFLRFERKSFGIVFRLALPVLMFLFIVGFAFWSEITHRVDVTITMLLAVSAMYLIIGQVIPLVGYYTILDEFITTSFCILSLTAGIHYTTANLDFVKYKYPMNEMKRDLVVYFCRVVWVPAILGVGLLYYFQEVQYYLIIPVGFVILFTTVSTIFQSQQLEITFRKCICGLRVKHYYKEMDKPFLMDCKDKRMLEGENLVTLDLTWSEAMIYSLTYRLHCACDCKLRKEKLKFDNLSIHEKLERKKSSSDRLTEKSQFPRESVDDDLPFYPLELNDEIDEEIESASIYLEGNLEKILTGTNDAGDDHAADIGENNQADKKKSPISPSRLGRRRTVTKTFPDGLKVVEEDSFIPIPIPPRIKKPPKVKLQKQLSETLSVKRWFFSYTWTDDETTKERPKVKDYPFFCQHVKQAIQKIEKSKHFVVNSNYKGSCENYFCIRCYPKDRERKKRQQQKDE